MRQVGHGLREQRKERTRSAFLDAAMSLFLRRGFDAVTVEEICDEVGVSARTFFRYFKTKEEVALAPLDELASGLLGALRACGSGEPAWRSLREALLASADRLSADSRRYLRFNQVIRRSPHLVATNAGALAAWERELAGEVARRLGVSREDPRARLLVGVALCALRVGGDAWADTGGARPAREHVEAALGHLDPAARSVEAATAWLAP